MTPHCKLAHGLAGQAPTLMRESPPFLPKEDKDVPATRTHTKGQEVNGPKCARSIADVGRVCSGPHLRLRAGTMLEVKMAEKRGSDVKEDFDTDMCAPVFGSCPVIAALVLVQVLARGWYGPV